MAVKCCLISQHQDLLFVSDSAYYQQGKAIKGGVPVCWPWFGPDPEGKGRPAHGFVRNRQWEVRSTTESDDGIKVILGVSVNEQTRNMWPKEFDLSIEIIVGASLEIALITRNPGNHPITITQALHTYFAVGDIAKVEVLGLESRTFIDKLDNDRQKTQKASVKIESETDRIYLDVESPLKISDQSLGRSININSTGAKSSVVWNPWEETAARMADLGNNDYQHMLCVETTNAGPDQVTVESGSEYRLVANFSID